MWSQFIWIHSHRNRCDGLVSIVLAATTSALLLLSFCSREHLLKHKRFDFGSVPSGGRLWAAIKGEDWHMRWASLSSTAVEKWCSSMRFLNTLEEINPFVMSQKAIPMTGKELFFIKSSFILLHQDLTTYSCEILKPLLIWTDAARRHYWVHESSLWRQLERHRQVLGRRLEPECPRWGTLWTLTSPPTLNSDGYWSQIQK